MSYDWKMNSVMTEDIKISLFLAPSTSSILNFKKGVGASCVERFVRNDIG